MCVKSPLLETWIHGSCPPTPPPSPIRTYTCRITIILKVLSGVYERVNLDLKGHILKPIHHFNAFFFCKINWENLFITLGKKLKIVNNKILFLNGPHLPCYWSQRTQNYFSKWRDFHFFYKFVLDWLGFHHLHFDQQWKNKKKK